MRDRKYIALAGAALLLMALSVGCSPNEPDPSGPAFETTNVEETPPGCESAGIIGEAVTPSGLSVLDASMTPTPTGELTKSTDRATIDYSNTADGYVMVSFTDTTSTQIKVLIMGPNTDTSDTRYQYDLPAQQWVAFPLADGNGSYTVKVLEQKDNGKYGTVVDATFDVSLADEFAPFVRPNQYVDYSSSVSPNTISEAQRIAGCEADPLKKVEKIYDFVIRNFTYDKAKADTVQSGYLPVLDTVLAQKKGICFDYAALMTGMLRSQGVPCKLITGWVDNGAYHAWISVWTKEAGWIDNAIYFDGTTWQRMDPTFASNGNSSESIMEYIGNGSNYKARWAF